MISVVVVNWNAGPYLFACIDSIAKHSLSLVKKIIVVDNGSTDGSMAAIECQSKIKVILANDNLGFGKACNLGATHADSEFILFLNPDAALFPGTLTKTLEYMQDPTNTRVGICGVQLLDESGHISRSCARFPSALGLVSHALGLQRIIPRLGHFMTEWDHAQTRRVDHVIGAFFMVRRQLFNDLDGFDERFFVYLEDLDFSLRARKLGWSSVYFADAQAFHAGGGTSKQIKARRLFYSLRSRLLYAFKHFNSFGATAVLIATLLVEPLSRSALAFVRHSWPALKQTWVAYIMLFRYLFKTLKT